MSTSTPQRRLAVILAADVVGYGRLISQDEQGTLAALRQFADNTLRPLVESSNGRIFKTMGDGFLVEFASPTDAVNCAMDWQRCARHAAGSHTDENAIVFRIGINLGEVFIDGDDVLGDGVNIATRLEAICPSGGICISEMVTNTIATDLPVQFEDFGQKRLKNVRMPIHAYLVSQGVCCRHRPSASAGYRPPEPGALLPVQGRYKHRPRRCRTGISACFRRQLDDPSRMGLGGAIFAGLPERAVQSLHHHPLRPARQRHVRLGRRRHRL